ncbi:hypothetical protein PVL29_024638 [Vitis rotundifolia]|nr:hypothetical protein PVL29_024638 [Vitis rotundifolia]
MAFANPESQRASSVSISTRGRKYDVFLSFRGEDTRHNFTDHLYRALNQKRIHTFRDNEELPRGEEIAPELLKAIEESRICLIVLSKFYAHSRWCLDELAKIMECRQKMGKLVFPIFYQVDPPDVERQRGSFGEAFSRYGEWHGDEGKVEEGKVERWREALKMVANIMGWCLYDRPEAHVIEEITSTVWKSLNQELFHVEKNLVGMDRPRASSSSTSIGPWDYEVFLSFTGEDTSYSFADHLYAALYQNGIRTFRLDDHKGEEIESCNFKAIEKARCILVILSKHYAHSRWRLRELVQFIECKNQNGKLVFPIFYHVEPSDVRKQMSTYAEAFQDHERNCFAHGFAHETQRWRAALTEVANLSGWHVQNG